MLFKVLHSERIYLEASQARFPASIFFFFSRIVFSNDVFILSMRRINEEFRSVRLQDLRVIATLGVGGFGRVELVQIASDSSRSYALKQMKKSQVWEIIKQNE